MTRFLAALAVLACTVLPAAALELVLPAGARQVSERISALDSYALPVGAFAGETLPTERFEGRIERQTWRVDTPGVTTLQVLEPLRDQIERERYQVVFQCEDRTCGGFDFRFATEVVPAPDMYVDIRNFRFLSAVREGGEAIGLLVSRTRSAAYVQIVYVNRRAAAPEQQESAPLPQGTPEDTPEDTAGDLTEALVAQGFVALGDLVFDTGAAALDPGDYASLAALARYLDDNPGIVIALVGHTDSIGSLQDNISLSKRRAQSVRTRLVETYGIAPERVQAEGMGYLAPVASNLTSEGREANRRVEAILISEN